MDKDRVLLSFEWKFWGHVLTKSSRLFQCQKQPLMDLTPRVLVWGCFCSFIFGFMRAMPVTWPRVVSTQFQVETENIRNCTPPGFGAVTENTPQIFNNLPFWPLTQNRQQKQCCNKLAVYYFFLLNKIVFLIFFCYRKFKSLILLMITVIRQYPAAIRNRRKE